MIIRATSRPVSALIPRVASLAIGVIVVSFLGPAPAASAASQITARGVVLAASASCRYGDVDIDYTATGAEQQQVRLSAGQKVVNSFTVAAFKADYTGVEHILSRATPPLPAGTEMTVYVTVGTVPPTAATTAEFLLTYRCTPTGNEAGGNNVVLASCFGAYGSCTAATPTVATPKFTG